MTVDRVAAPVVRWAKPAFYGAVAVAGLAVMVVSEPVRYSAFAGAATVTRPATVLPVLATVLLMAGAHRAAPLRVVATVRLGVVAGLSAAATLVLTLKVLELIRPQVDRYTVKGRFDHGSWVVTAVAVAAIALGLVLLLFRGLDEPEPFGERPGRAVLYGVVAGIVPGASAYTFIFWPWFGVHPAAYDDPVFAMLARLPGSQFTPTAPMALGLVFGWVVAMVAVASAGRALGEAVPPATRPVLHRAGAGLLAVAGVVLIHFMLVERGFVMVGKLGPEKPTLLRATTHAWATTLGRVHPGLVTAVLAAVAAGAATLVVVRSRGSNG